MLPTYPAVLRQNRIEWTGETPPGLSADESVPVHVTLLAPPPVAGSNQGQRMAAALEKLANSALAQIADPLAWERERREDRGLPGREP